MHLQYNMLTNVPTDSSFSFTAYAIYHVTILTKSRPSDERAALLENLQLIPHVCEIAVLLVILAVLVLSRRELRASRSASKAPVKHTYDSERRASMNIRESP